MKSVAFDYSGTFLGIGGGGDNGNVVHVKVVKDWSTSVVSDVASKYDRNIVAEIFLVLNYRQYQTVITRQLQASHGQNTHTPWFLPLRTNL